MKINSLQKLQNFCKSLLCLVTLAVCFSCNNLTDKNPVAAKTAYLKVSIDKTIARTVLPEITSVTDFSFTLKGKKDGATDWSYICGSASESVSYSVLTSPIALETGSWIFDLTATKGGTTLQYTTPSSSPITISTGENNITFTLVWQDTLLNGTGSLQFTLDYSGASNASDVKAVTGELIYCDASNNFEEDPTNQNSLAESDTNISISSNSATYTVSNLPAGNYKIKIYLYADTAKQHLINTWPELAIISGGQQSKATQQINSLNQVYTITYNTSVGTVPSDARALYTKFSSAYTLPVLSQDGYIFNGWYNQDNERVQSIARGSTGDLVLTASWQALAEPGIDVNMEQSDTEDLTENIMLSDSSASDVLNMVYTKGTTQTYNSTTLIVTADTSGATGITISSYKWYVNGTYYPSFINVTETTDNTLTISSATKNGTNYTVDTTGKTLYLDIPSLIDDDSDGIINYGTKINITLVITVDDKDYSTSGTYVLSQVE